MVYKPEINQFFDFERMETTLKRWANENPGSLPITCDRG